MKMYEVGGCIRDEILGVPSKDIDFTVVLDESEQDFLSRRSGFITPFQLMVDNLRGMGFKIFLETPEHLTVRAQFPASYEFKTFDEASGRPNYVQKKGLTADFVLARKEGIYSDGRRPDSVEPGTLMDDLARRDFTMNAIAKAPDGSYIDPFNGVMDIRMRIIRAVGDPMERLTEDALRAVRAIRFAVTKGFDIERDLAKTMESFPVWKAVQENISDERIQVELSKMFRYDTVESIRMLQKFPALTSACFAGSVSLDSTMKTKGRGK